MNFTDITIDNYKDMRRYIIGTKINEYGITPSCLYAPYDSAKFAEYKGFLIIHCEDEGKAYYSLAGDFSNPALGSVLHELYSRSGELNMQFLTAQYCDIVKSFFPGADITVDTAPDQYDYMYEIQDFIKLSGKKLRHKREHYNFFINNYDFRFEEISSKNKQDCIPIINGWCARKNCDECEYCCERDVVMRLLSRWKDYPVRGGIIYISDMPSAFLICEPLGDTVMGYHQKTATTEIRGLSHAVYIETMKNLFSDYKYFNIGPDIGLPGLRQFKRQFKPYTMIEKYNLSVK